jgi:acetate kinase
VFLTGVERFGEPAGRVSHRFGEHPFEIQETTVPDDASAVHITLDRMGGRIPVEIMSVVGFKIVPAKGVTGCMPLAPVVSSAMEEYVPLAPVHTAAHLTAIRVFEKLLPERPRIGISSKSRHPDCICAACKDRPGAHTLGRKITHGIFSIIAVRLSNMNVDHFHESNSDLSRFL